MKSSGRSGSGHELQRSRFESARRRRAERCAAGRCRCGRTSRAPPTAGSGTPRYAGWPDGMGECGAADLLRVQPERRPLAVSSARLAAHPDAPRSDGGCRSRARYACSASPRSLTRPVSDVSAVIVSLQRRVHRAGAAWVTWWPGSLRRGRPDRDAAPGQAPAGPVWSSTISACSLASGAPTQKWMPLPKDRWWRPRSRRMSNVPGSGNAASSWFAEPQDDIQGSSPAGISTPPTRVSLTATRDHANWLAW